MVSPLCTPISAFDERVTEREKEREKERGFERERFLGLRTKRKERGGEEEGGRAEDNIIKMGKKKRNRFLLWRGNKEKKGTRGRGRND